MARSAPNSIKVLIVDDQRTFGDALSVALGKEKDLVVIDVVTDGEAAVESSERNHPDVVIMDLAMPGGMDGIEATRRIMGDDPEARVIVLTGQMQDLTLARAAQAGATGCMPKTEAVNDLAGAVRRAHKGEPLMDEVEVEEGLRRLRHRRDQEASLEQRLDRLTPRELEILQLTADGLAGEEIADVLRVSPHTLRTHVQNVLTKLRVHSKLEAVVAAIRFGKIRAASEAIESNDESSDRGENGEPIVVPDAENGAPTRR